MGNRKTERKIKKGKIILNLKSGNFSKGIVILTIKIRQLLKHEGYKKKTKSADLK